MADGFLGRWSQRKQAVRAGQITSEPAAPLAPAEVLPGGDSPVADAAFHAGNPAVPGAGQVAGQGPQPAPTLDDVRALTADSSYAPFVARDVAPDVRNAAMKKLFADLTRQQAFFAAHIQPWVFTLCDSLQQHPKARFYAAVAALTRAFMRVEAQGFDMLA
jgi:hypothetical protein